MCWEQKVNRYFSARSSVYHRKSKSGIWGKVRNLESSSVVKALELSESDQVLEIGCGSGYYSLLMQDKVSHLVSIDKSAAMIATANKYGVKAILADVSETQDESFDKVLLAGVVEFAKDPTGLVRIAQKKLRTGGRLVILYPRQGFVGLGYQWFHQVMGCPVHSGKSIAAIFSGKGWSREQAGPLAWCSVWQNNG